MSVKQNPEKYEITMSKETIIRSHQMNVRKYQSNIWADNVKDMYENLKERFD